MDNKPSRSSAVLPPATTNPSVIQSTRKTMGIDVKYFLTIPGILKIAEIILGIICAAVCGKAYFSGNEYFLFVTIFFIIMTTILLFVHFAKIPKSFNLPGGIRWSFLEFFYAVMACISYLIAASVQVARTSLGDNACFGDVVLLSNGAINCGGNGTFNRYMAAGIIAFLNVILYGVDAYLHYKEYRDNRPQGPV